MSEVIKLLQQQFPDKAFVLCVQEFDGDEKVTHVISLTENDEETQDILKAAVDTMMVPVPEDGSPQN